MHQDELTDTPMNTIESQFQSQGTTCVGTLMLPEEVELPPVVVMAHGFANIRKARLPAYAERFVEAGYAVFLFDYRTFGDSEGEPRHLVHPWKQIQDWEAAIEYVNGLPAVDSGRMVLWGTSFSGGHVLHIASRNDAFAAVISQIPHVSGPATALKAHPLTSLKCTVAGLLDLAGGLVNKPVYSPVVGQPGERAAITGNRAIEGYYALLPADANWDNRVRSKSFLYIPFYSPRNDAHRITAPTLVIAARHDSVVSTSAARRAALRIPGSTFRILDCNHFQPYVGEHFEQVVAMQLEFLREHVPVVSPHP